jgi:hypothetical protein
MVIEDVLTMYYGLREAVAFAAPNALGIDEVWALVVPREHLTKAPCKRIAGRNWH